MTYIYPGSNQYVRQPQNPVYARSVQTRASFEQALVMREKGLVLYRPRQLLVGFLYRPYKIWIQTGR
jgi:hypothetical protein